VDIRTVYLKHVYEPDLFPKMVEKSIAKAEQLRKELKFDTIAFSGMSGAAIAFILGHWLDIPLLCIRRKEEGSHFRSSRPSCVCEGNIDTKRYLIVDDFISSGATVNYIIESIDRELFKGYSQPECVGMLMYAGYSDSEHKHPNWGHSVRVISARPEDT
jgi:hypoxanthine phosphoribosyltransferase